jgi:hypothetical protein
MNINHVRRDSIAGWALLWAGLRILQGMLFWNTRVRETFGLWFV